MEQNIFAIWRIQEQLSGMITKAPNMSLKDRVLSESNHDHGSSNNLKPLRNY